MDDKQIQIILTLQNITGIGSKKLEEILHILQPIKISSCEELYNSLITHDYHRQIKKLKDVSESNREQVVEKAWELAYKIKDESKSNEVKILTKDDSKYPKILKNIPDPPVLLHVKGNVDVLQKDSIAVVGTRDPTQLSTDVTKEISKEFCKKDFCIVSGLARGIDSEAHKSALEESGSTVAVLAHGLHTINPAQNRELAKAIIEGNGALITEYPWGTESHKGSFIHRNRIQSGLSLGVVVVETKENGGTCHTASYCEKQGRNLIVFKPPDEESYEKYKGNLRLIERKKVSIFNRGEDIGDLMKDLEEFKILTNNQSGKIDNMSDCSYNVDYIKKENQEPKPEKKGICNFNLGDNFGNRTKKSRNSKPTKKKPAASIDPNQEKLSRF